MAPSRKARYSYSYTHTHTHRCTHPVSKCPVPFWENLSSEACTKMILIDRAPLLLLPREQSTVNSISGHNCYYHICFADEENELSVAQ